MGTAETTDAGWVRLLVLTLAVVVIAADVITAGTGIVVIGLLIVPCLIAGVTLEPRFVGALGVACSGAAMFAFAWNDNLGHWTHIVPASVVTAGAVGAWLVANLRVRLEREAAQTRLARQQLDAIVRTVDAGIMARHVDGHMVFVNQAAADILALPGPEAVAAAGSDELMDRFEVYDERGEELALADLPGARLLEGDLSPAPLVVRNVIKKTGVERWLLNKAAPVLAEDGSLLLAVNVVEDVTEAKRSEIAQRILGAAGRALARSDDIEAVLQSIADMVVPSLADWAGIELADPAGSRAVAIAHRDPEKVRLGWRLRRQWPPDPSAETGAAIVIRSGEPHLIHEITPAMLEAGAQDAEHHRLLREMGLNSIMIVPVRAADDVLGALTFVSSTARRFDDRDLELALDLGREIGQALRSARLHKERADIAHTLQASLLPGELPDIDGWDAAGLYRPAGVVNEAGGDFYEVVRTPRGWAAFIGDVAGKGAPAAAVTALARHTLAGALDTTGDPVRALESLNRRLRSESDVSLCTVAVLMIDDDGAEIAVCCAGHPLPLLRSADRVTPLGEPGTVLGAIDTPRLTLSTFTLAEGDQVLLFTDGVLDAVGSLGRFGEASLTEVLRGAPRDAALSVVSSLEAVLADFVHGPQTDDIACLALQRCPPSRPARPSLRRAAPRSAAAGGPSLPPAQRPPA